MYISLLTGVDPKHDDQRAVPRLLPRLPLGLRLQRSHHAEAGGGRAGLNLRIFDIYRMDLHLSKNPYKIHFLA